MFFLLLLATVAQAQLSGTYTISSNASQNPDFTSFGAAATALSAGVSGPVVFQVASGTYAEYVTLNEIAGASASNRVVFRGMGADNQQVVITSNAGYTDNSTLTLNGTDYVTFENMTMTSTSQNKAVIVRMRNGNTENRFENVRFIGAVSNTSLDNDKTVVYRLSGDWVDTNNEFVGCHFENGYIGLYYQGHNIYTLNDGVLVENCTFTNQAFKSVYISFTDHAIVRGNTVTNHTHDVLSNYHAMDLLRIRYGCVIENNVMNVTRNSNYATVFETRPAMGTQEEPDIIRNNMINLVSNVSSSWCCDLDDVNSSHVYFVNNTVKCSGTVNCGSIIVEKNWPNLFLYNNLVVNETNGYVFRFQSEATDRFSDYNRIAYSGSSFGRLGSTDYATLSDWTTGTGFDAHSALCTPGFVANNDLHITSSDGITVANPLSYVTTDIDDETRSNTPCAGADEYIVGVNLPPVVANPIDDIVFEVFPASQTIDLSNTFDDPDDPNEDIVITIVSNSNPDLVGVMLDNRTLQVERLQNANGSSTIVLQATSNEQSVQTSFSVQCIKEDLPPVVSNPLDPILFTEYPQAFDFDISLCFTDPDNYEWMDYTVQSCPDEVSARIENNDILVVSRTTPNAFNNKTLVIRAVSNGKSVDMEVSVSGEEVSIVVDVAHFEDVELESSGIREPDEGINAMLSGGWVFTNYYSPYFWGGFTASNHTNLNQSGMDAQYTAASGGGFDGSAQYAVAYAMGAQTEVSSGDGSPQTVTGCYVTNNLWAYQNMLEGDYTATPFGGATGDDPDWFKLTATGKNANGQTVGTLDFYLADYRFPDSKDDYVLNTWEWFDLSALGQVASISFSLSSSKNNSGGMITPAYFCMDDFNGNAPSIPDLPPVIVNPVPDVVMNKFPETVQIELDGVAIDPDDPDEQITYSIVFNSNPDALSANLNGKMLVLNRLTEGQAWANIALRAESDGQYASFTIHVTMNAGSNLPPYIVNPLDEIVFDQYPQTINVGLNGVATDPDDPDEQITYSIVSNSNTMALSAVISGKTLILNRLYSGQAEADLSLCALSNGQTAFFNLHVILNETVGMDENKLGIAVYPNPTSGRLTISVGEAAGFNYRVYNLMGQSVMRGSVSGKETHVDLSRLISGIYYISIECDDNCLVNKVIVK